MSGTRGFRGVFLPYCLQRQDDGRYVVLNRRYQALGMDLPLDAAASAPAPTPVQIKGLSETLVARLDWRGKPDADGTIYLYGGDQMPTTSAEAWDAYQKRLALLAELRLG